MKKITFNILFFLITISVYSQELRKIESFEGPEFPKLGYTNKETYDYRVESNSPVPPSLTDVFICDLWQRISKDLEINIAISNINTELVEASFVIYLYRDWENIAGYRPWTHWNFIRNLTKKERDILALEVVEYIKLNGVKDVK